MQSLRGMSLRSAIGSEIDTNRLAPGQIASLGLPGKEAHLMLNAIALRGGVRRLWQLNTPAKALPNKDGGECYEHEHLGGNQSVERAVIFRLTHKMRTEDRVGNDLQADNASE